MSEQLSGRELDKAIAEALGYTVVWITWTPVSDADPGGMWCLVDQFGKQAMEGSQDKDAAWFVPSPPGRSVFVRGFHADANATLAVCAERGWALAFCGAEKNPKARFATITIFNDADEIDEAEYQRMTETTYQEAAARALLAALTATADR